MLRDVRINLDIAVVGLRRPGEKTLTCHVTLHIIYRAIRSIELFFGDLYGA